ncbi:uncharacterized protein [Miscanthus floridulus]|uniref:uncharacterized protein n=1 Tax=Miscanthus floridulus TaxID=154761 RepID=UPI0034575CE5
MWFVAPVSSTQRRGLTASFSSSLRWRRTFRSTRWMRASVSAAMYISAPSSSSASATWAAPFFFPRQSLAQWPLFAAVVAESVGRWLPATGIADTRVLAVATIARRGSYTASSASTPTALPAVAGAGAATGVLLLTACLVAGFPIFLAEHQAPHGIRDLLWLGALLEHAQPSNHLLDGDLVQIEEHLEGDSGLVQPFRDHLQQLLHYLSIGDVVAEGAEVGGERGDADAEPVDALPFLEGEVTEFPAELLRAGVARAFVADPQVLDRVPRLFHRALDGEGAPELGGHRA